MGENLRSVPELLQDRVHGYNPTQVYHHGSDNHCWIPVSIYPSHCCSSDLLVNVVDNSLGKSPELRPR